VNQAEKAGVFSPLNEIVRAGRQSKQASAPGLKAHQFLRLNFVGLKPHAFSVMTRAKLHYTMARNA
jgi:hypothetical protein